MDNNLNEDQLVSSFAYLIKLELESKGVKISCDEPHAYVCLSCALAFVSKILLEKNKT